MLIDLFALGAETKRRNLKGVTSCAFVDNSFYPVACSAKPGCFR